MNRFFLKFRDGTHRLQDYTLQKALESRTSLRVKQAKRDGLRMQNKIGILEGIGVSVSELVDGTTWRTFECISGKKLPYASGCLAKTRDAFFSIFR